MSTEPLSHLTDSTPQAVPSVPVFALHPTSESTAATVHGVKCNKIMIVDDEPIAIKTALKYLQQDGYQSFVTLTDPSQAIELIRKEQPDVVLLDIVMPQANGLELLGTIRNDEQLQHLPVVILTASTDATTKRDALEQGATDFLAKPVDPSELVLRVRNVLVVKAHQDHLARYALELESEVRARTAKLLASRHEAAHRYLEGKAEIAGEVLHNVGNILSSVNVSLSIIRQCLQDTRWLSLPKTAQLVLDHADDLAQFFATDQRAQLLPEYLAGLSKHLMAERKRALDEIENLNDHMDHIRAVLASQHKYAGLSGVREPVTLSELLRDAEELGAFAFGQQGIEVDRQYEDVPEIMSEKQKLLQILVNLMRNAQRALANSPHPDKRLTFRIRQRGTDYLCIDIQDNGVGISRDHLLRIFTFGFTTKAKSQGLGLHSCAKLAGELGGSLTGDSDGPGKGATFTLELPRKQAEVMG